jgi:uncharacterized SAM-binding protein YcdF (DUF218 family)
MKFLLPLLLTLIAIGLTLGARQRPARRLAWLGAGLAAVLSMPVVGTGLIRLLEVPAGDPLAQSADAIVVLGAGTYFSAPEYGGDTVNRYALERLRYAALLHRRSARPILLTGGTPEGNAVAEALQMKAVLASEWGVPVAWTEVGSVNTLESGRESHAILSAAGVRRIYLVTHAWHMRRAMFAFERAGFEVVPAPTAYATRFRLTPGSFVPGSEGLLQSSIFCQEAVGLIWYRLRFM